jgi:hypothetical protein
MGIHTSSQGHRQRILNLYSKTIYGQYGYHAGIAVRVGEVSYSQPVPEPSTAILFMLGLLGILKLKQRP